MGCLVRHGRTSEWRAGGVGVGGRGALLGVRGRGGCLTPWRVPKGAERVGASVGWTSGELAKGVDFGLGGRW